MNTATDIKYSVIIPAYNAEKTISKCLNSLLKQMHDREDTEIIIVNDGSLDRTEQMCKEFMNSSKFIKCFHIENSGVSVARNIGLKASCGEYIIFVDSDDYVTDSFLQAVDHAVSEEWDLSILNYQTFNGYKTIKRVLQNYRSNERKNSIAYLTNCLKRQELNTVYGKIFRHELIVNNSIEFPEGLQIGEDKVFMTKYAMAVRSLNVSDQIAYTVCSENMNSLSRMKRDLLYNNIIHEHSCLFNMANELLCTDPDIYQYFAKAITYSFFRSAYSSVFELNKSDLKFTEAIEEIKKILNVYNRQNFKYEMDWESKLVSLPVKYNLSLLMFLVMKCVGFKKEISNNVPN